VLSPDFRHYAEDLRRVGQTGARLIEALAVSAERSDSPYPVASALPFHRHPFPGIQDLASELLALKEPLRALAGPEIQLDIECAACAGELALNAEDLIRILFNLVANTVEAMRSPAASQRGGNRRPFLRITAQLGSGASFVPLRMSGPPSSVILSVRDNGPGISAEDLPHIFDPGFSTRGGVSRLTSPPGEASGPQAPAGAFHGLGLAIVRQLVEAAGGSVRAVSSPGIGVRFDIELPILGPGGTPQRPSGDGPQDGPPIAGPTLLSPSVGLASSADQAGNRTLKRFPQTAVKGAYNATNNRN
jgi:signal transduction histidine kinase